MPAYRSTQKFRSPRTARLLYGGVHPCSRETICWDFSKNTMHFLTSRDKAIGPLQALREVGMPFPSHKMGLRRWPNHAMFAADHTAHRVRGAGQNRHRRQPQWSGNPLGSCLAAQPRHQLPASHRGHPLRSAWLLLQGLGFPSLALPIPDLVCLVPNFLLYIGGIHSGQHGCSYRE